MKLRAKKVLKTAILLSILYSCPYSVSFADGVITNVSPDPGTYESINRVVNGGDGLKYHPMVLMAEIILLQMVEEFL